MTLDQHVTTLNICTWFWTRGVTSTLRILRRLWQKGNSMFQQEKPIPVVQTDLELGTAYIPAYPNIIPDTPSWVAWLDDENTTDFAFYEHASDEKLSMVSKVKDDNALIWYISRRGQTKMRRIKLGVSADITISRLIEATNHLIKSELQEEQMLRRQF